MRISRRILTASICAVSALVLTGPVAMAEGGGQSTVVKESVISVNESLDIPEPSVSLQKGSGSVETVTETGVVEPYLPEVGKQLTVNYANATVTIVRPTASCSVSSAAIKPTRAANGYASAGSRGTVAAGCAYGYKISSALLYRNLGGGYPSVNKTSTPISPGVTKNLYVSKTCKSSKSHSWMSQGMVSPKVDGENNGWVTARSDSPRVNINCSI